MVVGIVRICLYVLSGCAEVGRKSGPNEFGRFVTRQLNHGLQERLGEREPRRDRDQGLLGGGIVPLYHRDRITNWIKKVLIRFLIHFQQRQGISQYRGAVRDIKSE